MFRRIAMPGVRAGIGSYFSNSHGSKPAANSRLRSAVAEVLEGRQLFSVFTVTSIADSGAGTLRDAITQANAHTGADEIDFNIAGVGVHKINVLTALPTITQQVILSGYSQAGASANTNPIDQGDNAKILIEIDGSTGNSTRGINIQAPSVTVEGLAVHGFSQANIYINGHTHDGTRIFGNFIGTDATGMAAGAAPAGANSGILITGRVVSTNVGSDEAASRNVISGNKGAGVTLTGDSANAFLYGNFIGINAAGTAALGNATGVTIASSGTNFIGSDGNVRNVISGNTQYGIFQGVNPVLSSVVGDNYIGVGIDGTTAMGNGSHGVFTVAGTQLVNNIIANNGGDGVFAGSSGVNSPRLTNNSIYNNNLLGFAYGDAASPTGSAASTPRSNDNLDKDGIANYPVITSATISGGQIEIQGSINSLASSTFTLQFFASPSADASGFGEGENFVGSVNVLTDSNGNATFDATFAAPPAGSFVTAYATFQTASPNPNLLGTSEFSQAVQTTTGGPVSPSLAISDVTLAEGKTGTTAFVFTVTRSGDTSGASTVSYLTADGSATAPGDYTAIGLTPLTFAANETSKTITVLVNGDTTNEPDETFNVLLSNASNAVIADGTGVGTIVNDDAPAAKPAAPSGLTGHADSGTQITLNWTDLSNNETGFEIQRSASSTFSSPTTFSVGPNVQTYSDNTLSLNTYYYYRVRAVNGPTPSAYSKSVKIKTLKTAGTGGGGGTGSALATPTSFTAKAVAGGNLMLNWADIAVGEKGYEIQVSTVFNFATIVQDVTVPTPNLTTFTTSGLSKSTWYYVRVRAVSDTASLDSAFTSSIKVKTLSA